MHEFSIVQSLLNLIEEQAKLNNAKQVSKVLVKIGKMSGVEPHLLEMAFNTFKEKTIAENAELIIEIQDIIAYCKNCNIEFVIQDYSFICPDCKSIDVDVIDGTEMLLKSLELEM
ncbi:hydrogenase maturation nickel metallochaperone HypA [Sulfurihydrogenibium sp.]|uniref:hydrogenase maturation nickel metallochaperone HypA n=1 Tax=Sulfurihydrogenibium sp. TaxID=2053621 RepID=UPI00262CDB1D|nr:hydrogenase maturation nickel metallochaperone HypA [Sulfurihydrogenibium sp.]